MLARSCCRAIRAPTFGRRCKVLQHGNFSCCKAVKAPMLPGIQLPQCDISRCCWKLQCDRSSCCRELQCDSSSCCRSFRSLMLFTNCCKLRHCDKCGCCRAIRAPMLLGSGCRKSDYSTNPTIPALHAFFAKRNESSCFVQSPKIQNPPLHFVCLLAFANSYKHNNENRHQINNSSTSTGSLKLRMHPLCCACREAGNCCWVVCSVACRAVSTASTYPLQPSFGRHCSPRNGSVTSRQFIMQVRVCTNGMQTVSDVSH